MKTGRNDPCPCGSGKKYKKCCLDAEYKPVLNEQHPEFYDFMEEEYDQAIKDHVFDILKVLELDVEKSEQEIIEAIQYFNESEGQINDDCPTGFLSSKEYEAVFKNGQLRPKLYAMLLSASFAQGIESGKVFLKHSNKYSY